MTNKRVSWIEDPNKGIDVCVSHDEIEQLAAEDGIEQTVEEMDDATFEKYADMILDRMDTE